MILAVLLMLSGCAHRAVPVPSHGSRSLGRVARVHLLSPRKPAHTANPDLAERDVLLAQEAFLSQSPGSAERAAELYRAAAARGSAVAEYNLGVFYEKGLGVPTDRTVAATWYGRAVANQDPAIRTLANTGLASVTATPAQAGGAAPPPGL